MKWVISRWESRSTSFSRKPQTKIQRTSLASRSLSRRPPRTKRKQKTSCATSASRCATSKRSFDFAHRLAYIGQASQGALFFSRSQLDGLGYRKNGVTREASVTLPKGKCRSFSFSSLATYLHGEEINDSKGEPEAEILKSHRAALFQVRAATWLHARFQPLPHLFPRGSP